MALTQEQIAKGTIDVASVTTVVGTLAEQLPVWAAFFTIVWSVIRIYETETVRNIIDWIRYKFKRNK